jgi:hypothetical protein
MLSGPHGLSWPSFIGPVKQPAANPSVSVSSKQLPPENWNFIEELLCEERNGMARRQNEN